MRGFASEEILLPLAAPILHTTLARRPPGSPRQSPRHLRFGRSAADRRDRSHFRVRLRPGLRHPGQGQGAHADFGVLVRADAARSCPTTCSRPISPTIPGLTHDDAAALAGRSMLVAQGRTAADRMRGARLPVGIGLEGLRRDRRGVRHPAAGRAAGVLAAAGADFHARRPKRRAGTTSTSASTMPARSSIPTSSTASAS